MIPAWVLAVVTIGLGFTVGAVLGVVRRDREHGSSSVDSISRVHRSVVVLINGREEDSAVAIEAAEKLVAREDIYVGTVPPEGYEYVLLLEPDHRPDPRFLDRTMPLFDDPDVVGVAGYARVDWSGPRVLTAYRARALALGQWLLTVARTRPRTEVARLSPSPARLFRTRVLADLDLGSNLSQQIYRRRLGRVLVVRGAVVDVAAPAGLGEYCTQVSTGARDFWRSSWRNQFPRGTPAFAVETAIASALWLALPVLVVTGVVTIPALLLGVFLPDLLLTLAVALRQREPRYLPVAFLLPFVRVLDASLVFLSLLPRRSVAVAGWLVAAASAVVFVFRVHVMAARLPVTSLEPSLVDAAYSRVAGLQGIPVAFDMWATTLQLVLYGGVSGSFSRYDSVLAGAREASVAAAAVLALCALLTAVVLRLHPLLVSAVLVVCCATADLFATAGPRAFAAAWLGVGALALAGAITRRTAKLIPAVIIAAIAVVLTVLPSPLAVVVPGLFVAALFGVAILLDRLPRAARPAFAVAALAAVAAVALGVPTVRPVAPTVDHRAIADWLDSNATSDLDLSAPPLLWSDLTRDLADTDGRVRRGGPAALAVDGPGLPVATFPGATVTLTAGGAGFVGDGNRVVAGVDLAANTRITAPEPVRLAFSTGRVDFRVMAVLAEISAQTPITIADVTNPEPEYSSELPLRTVVLSAVDGRPVTDPAVAAELRAWFSAQLPPYAPDDFRSTDEGFAVSWRLSGDPVPN
ncbi:glycosyltransferase family 2 protein [Actinokineospora globicatena]|uniref:glycosyltransferase family 2 protein n=1 Tax=Actinokineospora globicatena TaxID=103729 RepID=UPI0020A58BA6|nr:glycosyltransferase family 2 protein [Actinokineospora globicatena]